MSDLHYLSEPVLEELKGKVAENLELYRSSGFADLAGQIGWNIRLVGREFDLGPLADLDLESKGVEGDLKNSRIVWQALSKLTPSEANEEQIWVRLSHLEGFEYAKARWLNLESSEDVQIASIKKHFFASGRTGIRDDHALSRLWWNASIANLAYPENPSRALELILKSADIRSAIVERPWVSVRQPLLHGILAVLDSNEDSMTEAKFRDFIKEINRRGAGIVFEAMNLTEVDTFVRSCLR